MNMNPLIVILSACETGLGRTLKGDEVQSLSRAFIYAGAGGVVSSLWKVDDKATCELMNIFYRELRSKSPAQALSAAQKNIKEKYPDPFFWAPFFFTGADKK